MTVDVGLIRRALEIARFAPSAHNAQPWRVRRDGEVLFIESDESRRLAYSDPLRRDHELSLGAFKEALQLSLAALGVESFNAEANGAFAALRFRPGTPRDAELLSLLRRRQSSRLAYSPRFPDGEKIVALEQFSRAQGLRLHLFAKGSEERSRVDGLLFAALREGWLDGRSVAELKKWIKFDPAGVLSPQEGLSTNCLGLGAAEAAALKASLNPSLWRALGKVFVAPVVAEALAKSELQPIEKTPLFAVLISDGAANRCGGALLRVWLEATRLGLALHPVSALLDRRGWELGKLLAVPSTRFVLAFRLGNSAPPPRSGRRPVEAFALGV